MLRAQWPYLGPDPADEVACWLLVDTHSPMWEAARLCVMQEPLCSPQLFVRRRGDEPAFVLLSPVRHGIALMHCPQGAWPNLKLRLGWRGLEARVGGSLTYDGLPVRVVNEHVDPPLTRQGDPPPATG